MLKVLVVIPSGTVYGLQNATLDLMRGLNGKRIHFHFLITRWTDGELAHRLEKLDIPYTYSWLGMFSRRLDGVNLNMTANCLLKIPRLYRDFLELVKSYNPNIIYTANYHELILLAPVLRAIKIPVLNHMHDPPPSIPFQRRVFNFWDRLVNRYVTVSCDVQSRLEELGARSEKISLLENGVDLSLFPYQAKRSDHFVKRYGWPSGSVILGMTGQMIEEKGHLDLIEVVKFLYRDYRDIRLVIGGKQSGPYYQKLVSETMEKRMSEIIAFSGWQEHVRDFFSGIDIFVLPSRHEEGFGLVAAQAMAVGLPVVATCSGGVNEVVENGTTGFVVEKESFSELANATRCLMKSSQLRRSMGSMGRRRVEERFDLLKQAEKFRVILETIDNRPCDPAHV